MATYTIVTDVLIHGNTYAASCAMLQCHALGVKAYCVTERQRIGGMSINSLIAYDAGRRVTADGSARDIGGYATMGTGITSLMWQDQARLYGSHDRRGRFQNPLTEHAIQLRLAATLVPFMPGMTLQSVAKTGTGITSATYLDASGDTWIFQAQIYIEAGIEGDFMAAAGCSWTIKREDEDQYGETLNGFGKGLVTLAGVSPYKNGVGGELCRGVLPYPSLSIGDEDDAMQILGIRLEISRKEDGCWSWYKPINYNEEDIEIRKRRTSPNATFSYGAASGLVYDLNNYDALPNVNNEWVMATPAQRGVGKTVNNKWDWAWTTENPASVYLKAVTTPLAQLWWQRNSRDSPVSLRESQKKWGPSKEAHPAQRGVAPEPYLRGGGRRLVGDYVFTQNEIQRLTGARNRYAFDRCGITTLKCDFHEHRWYEGPSNSLIVDIGGVSSALVPAGNGPLDKDGNVTTGIFAAEVPMRVMLPKASEVTNLLCAMACSESHVAQASHRCEKDYGNMGCAAAIVAYAALTNARTVHDTILNYPTVPQAIMRAQGMIIDIPGRTPPA